MGTEKQVPPCQGSPRPMTLTCRAEVWGQLWIALSCKGKAHAEEQGGHTLAFLEEDSFFCFL